ncbi:hypothetical protein N657DRAFT_672293 [Parathielavia appendiculata]|uniref:Uncharacterized protein n=1 Tax=Parathielavia appendiculata TaxID=2587402 RepID=A0AAN6Z2L4_9PEZI|nr:hypothetical protein N657DRAFT_672293 [Parathielavia appendiculata]
MLLRQDCPLCRLVCHAIVAKLSTETTIYHSGSFGDDEDVDSDDDELIGSSSSGGNTSYSSNGNGPDGGGFGDSDSHDELISADSSDGEADLDDDQSPRRRQFDYDSDDSSGSYALSSDHEDDESIGTTSRDDTPVDIFHDVPFDPRLRIHRDQAEEEVILSYVRAESLTMGSPRSNTMVLISHLMQAGKLLLRIRVSLMGLDITRWIHALALRPATLSGMPLMLHSDIRSERGGFESG